MTARILILAAALLSACAASAPYSDPYAAPAERTDCYDSTVPPQLAPTDIRDLPQCA